MRVNKLHLQIAICVTVFMVLGIVPVIANNQGLTWGISIGDRFYFYSEISGDEGLVPEEIQDIYYIEVEVLPTIPDDIGLNSTMPDMQFQQFYLNGTLMYGMYTFGPRALPIGNWDLQSDLIESTYGGFYNYSIIDSSNVWGYFINATLDTIHMELTLEYSKVDGVLTYQLYDIGYSEIEGHAHFLTRRDFGPPVLNSPEDIQYNDGTSGHTLTWHITEDNPSTYAVTRDGSILQQGDFDTDVITVDIDGLAYGSHFYEITVLDEFGFSDSDIVTVTVIDTTAPQLNEPDDIEFEAGEIGYLISWNPIDRNPEYYELLRNGELLRSGQWNSSTEVVEINLDSLVGGQYNFTLIVYDRAGNDASDSVVVTVASWPLFLGQNIGLSVTVGSFAVIIVFGALIIRNNRSKR
ncbi:MAG: hypothetical protein RTU30_09025 [Candidatus Thorarchaeota archaeon]